MMQAVTPMIDEAVLVAGEAGLARWRAYVESDAAAPGLLGVLGLEGYLTGIILQPSEIPLARWLAGLWGPAPQFATDADMAFVLNAINQVHQAVAARIAQGRHHYLPMFMPARGDPVLDDVRQWVAGFWKAVELRPMWWLELLDHRDLKRATLPFLGFIPHDDGQFMEETDENREQLLDHARSISVAVLVLDLFNKRRARSAAANPGRNAPCPCGSGRKYKQCCAY